MAFGGLRTTFKNSATSIGTSLACTGSQVVVRGDLIFVLGAEQTSMTITGVTDNLGNSYSSTDNTVNDAGTSTGRCFWTKVTVPGTLTTVTLAANGGTDNGVIVAAIIEGPIVGIDKNPANITSDVTSPFTCPSSTTLSQANEIVIGWLIGTGSTSVSATSPNLLADQQATATILHGAIGYQAVTATTAVAPEFTAGSNPTDQLMGTATFTRDDNPVGAGNRMGMQGPPNPTIPPRATSFYTIEQRLSLALQAAAGITYMPSVADFGSPPTPAPPIPQVVYSSPMALLSPQQAPFVQDDWPNPTPTTVRQVQSVGLNLPLNVRPFVQSDWPNPRGVPQLNLSWMAGPSLSLTAKPFNQNEWLNPQSVARPTGWINQGIRDVSTQAPFFQTDWPNPKPPQPQNLGFTFSQTIPPDTNTYMPSVVTDWGSVPPLPSPQASPEVNMLALRAGPVAAMPFNQYNWPNPRFVPTPVSLLTWTNGLPPITYVQRQAVINVPRPLDPTAARNATFAQNMLPLVSYVNVKPFKQADWPIPAPFPPPNRGFMSPLNLPIVVPPPTPGNVFEWLQRARRRGRR